MLVNAQKATIVQQLQRPDMDPTTAAASALYSGLIQGANNQATAAVQSASHTVSDNIDAAFAKTRVLLQATEPASSAPQSTTATQSNALADFKDYMSKTPEQRLRDSILKELGLTEESLSTMSPEQQLAVGKEIAQRMQDKMQLAEAEKAQERNNPQQADQLLAAL